MILAVTPEPVVREMVPSALRESAAAAPVSTRLMARGVAAPADSVTLRNTAVENRQSVQ